MKDLSKVSLAVIAVTSFTLVSVVLAQELGEPSSTEITTADCENAWSQASASSSCTTTVLNAEESSPGSGFIDNCVVKANCAATDGGAHDTFSDYHGGPDGVTTLVNCSGTLKASSCD